jgi:hypothetical protein
VGYTAGVEVCDQSLGVAGKLLISPLIDSTKTLHVCVFVSLHVSTTHDGMIFDALQASY